jgi:Holliday junction DNA helicase RuvA
MIAHLTGTVAAKGDDACVIEVAGVGYRVAMSTASLASLPAEGDEVTVHTHMHVREDEMALFGFESPAEQRMFERLITVSGVGPKVALAALSSYPVDTLSAAIVGEDVAVVSSIPGVGKKTAQRIILDLKDKLEAGTGMSGGDSAALDTSAEAREALAAMGFSTAEIAVALKGYDGAADDAQALLTYGLKRLGGGA